MARQIVGEIFLNVKPLDGGVSSGVQQIINKAESQAARVPVGLDTREATAAVDVLSSQIQNQVGESWQVAAGKAAAFTASVLGAKFAVEGVVNKLAGLFDQLAQAQAGFNSILGSEQSGQKLLDDIREFARVSPFVTQELVNYSQQLLGVGQSAESIVPLLKNTGDLIASVGGDTQNISRVLFTLTQIRSIGRLVGQDAIQLQSSLVPITKLLADFLGKTTQEVKKLQEQGAISADTVFAAINNAGSKVEGAMNNATRNISGARSVLSDTVTILFQDSEVLRRVFDDIVQGILAFADALGSPEIQKNLDRVFESLDSIYTSLQPLLEAIGETSASLALNSLDVLAASMEVLAGVLDAFPAEVLELVGRGLALLFAVKAPLALLTYVQRLGQLGSVLTSGNLARGVNNLATGIAATGTAAEAAQLPVTRVVGSIQRFGTAMSVAALAGGLFANSIADGNEAIENFGNSLSGAGIGAQLGSIFGPSGFVVGAAAGAGLGLVTSVINNTREEAEKRAGEFEAIGKRAAEDFLRGFSFGDGITSDDEFKELLMQVKEASGVAADLDAQLAALFSRDTELQLAIGDPNANDVPKLLDELDAVRTEIERIEGQALTAKGKVDALLSEDSTGGKALEALREKLASLNLELPEFSTMVRDAQIATRSPLGTNFGESMKDLQSRTILAGEAVPLTIEEFERLDPIFRELGLTAESVLNLSLEELVTLLSDDLPDALKETKIELDSLKLAFDEATKAAQGFFDPFETKVNAIKKAREESVALGDALNALTTGSATGEEQTAFATSLLNRIQTITAASQAVSGDLAKATEDGLSFANAQFEALQESLGLTTDEFKDLLAEMGLIDLFNASTDIESGFFGSLAELSEATGLTVSSLREILNIAEGLNSNTIDLTVTAETERILTQIDALEERLANAPQPFVFRYIQELKAEVARLLELGGAVSALGRPGDGNRFDPTDTRSERYRTTFAGNQAIRDALEKSRLAQEKAAEEARRLAEEAAREAEREARERERLAEEAAREAERFAASLKSAGETITSAMESAAATIDAAAESWTASIKERIQFEQAPSGTRLLTNVTQQASALDEITRGLEVLRSRGLSETAIDSIGIDNVTDLRQVRKLLQSDTATLQALSTVISQRDTNAEILARRQVQEENKTVIVAAIIESARILGFDISTERAIALSGQIDVTGVTSNGATVPTGLLEALLSEGRINR